MDMGTTRGQQVLVHVSICQDSIWGAYSRPAPVEPRACSDRAAMLLYRLLAPQWELFAAKKGLGWPSWTAQLRKQRPKGVSTMRSEGWAGGWGWGGGGLGFISTWHDCTPQFFFDIGFQKASCLGWRHVSLCDAWKS